MHLSGNSFWLLATLVGLFIAGGVLFLFLRGEKLGTLSLPSRVNLDMLTTTLTIARESGGMGPPTLQLRARLPALYFTQRIEARDAAQLADLLDSASARLRAP